MKLNTAILLSIVVHTGLLALLMSNFQFAKVEVSESSATTSKINARAVSRKQVEQLVENRSKQQQAVKRREQQRLDRLKKAENDAKRKRQEEAKKLEETKKKRLQAEKQRKAEEKKAIALKKKKQKEDEERKKKAEQEKVRKQKEDADRKSKAEAERKRKQREEEARKRKEKAEAERKQKEAEEQARQEAIEREMMAQMEAEEAELNAARQAQVMSEVSKYITLIQNKIKRNWNVPEKDGYCRFNVKLATGGLILEVRVIDGDPQYCDSGQRAIYKAEPLPVSNEADVFNQLKSINLTLDPKGEITQ